MAKPLLTKEQADFVIKNYIGITIAATGIVTFAADWLLFWWFKETKKERAKNGTKK